MIEAAPGVASFCIYIMAAADIGAKIVMKT